MDNAPAHRQNRLPDGRPPVRALAHLAKILSLECFKGSKNAPRALLSDKACFRDRYFEILAYLLTVLAETLRSSAMVLCGYPAAFMLWMASQSSQLVRLVPAGLPPPLDTFPPLAPRCACTWLNPAGVNRFHTQRAMLLAVALISLWGGTAEFGKNRTLS